MTRDEELDAILAMLCGELDDAELDRRVAGFRGAVRGLREDSAEDTRIDAVLAGADDGSAVVALVTRAAGGDPDAWAEIVELYTPLVWSICTWLKLSSAGIKNVAQMIWLLLAERLGKLRDPAALPGWLATTTRRECVRVINAVGESGQRQAKLDEALQFADDTAIDEEISFAERKPRPARSVRRAPAALPAADIHAAGRPAELVRGDQRDTEHPGRQHSARSELAAWNGCAGPTRSPPGAEKPGPSSGGAGQVHDSPDGR